jgi:hypothetical protein
MASTYPRGDNGLVWINGSDFAEGTIELDIRGRDLMQRSFVGIAFHGKGDTYESVYLRSTCRFPITTGRAFARNFRSRAVAW